MIANLQSELYSRVERIKYVENTFKSVKGNGTNQKYCNFNLRELFHFAPERLEPSYFSIELFGGATGTLNRTADLLKNNFFVINKEEFCKNIVFFKIFFSPLASFNNYL